MEKAYLLVDFRKLRCENCMVAISNVHDECCWGCGAFFEEIDSNHIGMANKIRKIRGIPEKEETRYPEELYPEMVSS
jgi:hypothetical protein